MGRELDMQIATEVFGIDLQGYINSPEGRRYPIETNVSMLPLYSSDMNAAMQIVEKLNLLEERFLRGSGTKWEVGEFGWHDEVIATGSSAAEAICKAALKIMKER